MAALIIHKINKDDIKYLTGFSKRMLFILFFILVFVVFFVTQGIGLNEITIGNDIKKGKQKFLSIDHEIGALPLYFVPNNGQVDKRVLFYARAAGYTLWVTKEGLVFDSIKRIQNSEFRIQDKNKNEKARKERRYEKSKSEIRNSKQFQNSRHVSWLVFHHAERNMQILPLETTRYRVNYYKGKNSSTWQMKIAAAKAVLYRNIYPGIDLKVYGIGKQIEYDWIVKPGGNPEEIDFSYKNVEETHIDEKGNLIIKTTFGELIHKKPMSFQENKSIRQKGNKAAREPVNVNFKKFGKNSYGFAVGNYDKVRELVIDPLIQLDYSTYLGGSEDDLGRDIAVDGKGNVYVTGSTGSLNFPLVKPYQEKYGGGASWKTESDVFVTKLSADGNCAGYSTYLGGEDIDEGNSIAVDDMGCAYITGITKSKNFPVKNPIRENFAGDRDLFVTKLSADGSTMEYSTFLGGTGYEVGEAIAVDKKGCAYVTGSTDSPDFPTENPLINTYGGGFSDAFVVKLSPTGASLKYAAFIGGDGSDCGKGIAVDGNGCALITGSTGSVDFPVKNPLQWAYAGGKDFAGSDAFVTKLSAQGDSFIYSTFLGGSGSDSSEDIAVDDKGCAYVTGVTSSSDFPLKNPLQEAAVHSCDEVIFVTKLCYMGNMLSYSTYLGTAVETSWGIAVDNTGCAYVTGSTWSCDFPVKNPLQASLKGQSDAFITKLSPHGSTISFSTYLGGSCFDQARGIAVDNSGNVYLTGYTNSLDFPLKNPLYKNIIKYNEAFITKVCTGIGGEKGGKYE